MAVNAQPYFALCACQHIQYTINALGWLIQEDQFVDIVVKTWARALAAMEAEVVGRRKYITAGVDTGLNLRQRPIDNLVTTRNQ